MKAVVAAAAAAAVGKGVAASGTAVVAAGTAVAAAGAAVVAAAPAAGSVEVGANHGVNPSPVSGGRGPKSRWAKICMF